MKQIANAFKMYLGEWHDCYPYQDVTLKQGIEARLRAAVPEVKSVESL